MAIPYSNHSRAQTVNGSKNGISSKKILGTVIAATIALALATNSASPVQAQSASITNPQSNISIMCGPAVALWRA